MLKQDKANIVIDLTQLHLIVIKFLNVCLLRKYVQNKKIKEKDDFSFRQFAFCIVSFSMLCLVTVNCGP